MRTDETYKKTRDYMKDQIHKHWNEEDESHCTASMAQDACEALNLWDVSDGTKNVPEWVYQMAYKVVE